MIVEIALCGGALALAVLAGALVHLLIQLRKPVAESEYLLVRMNAELPLLIKEMRVQFSRCEVESATVLLYLV